MTDPLLLGLADICTYRLGRRPRIKNDASLYRLVLGRFAQQRQQQ